MSKILIRFQRSVPGSSKCLHFLPEAAWSHRSVWWDSRIQCRLSSVTHDGFTFCLIIHATLNPVGSEFLGTVTMKNTVFCGVTPCRLLAVLPDYKVSHRASKFKSVGKTSHVRIISTCTKFGIIKRRKFVRVLKFLRIVKSQNSSSTGRDDFHSCEINSQQYAVTLLKPEIRLHNI